ncbi:ankyrin-3-like [Diabrotica virgifera virgifera]|uniref:Ankyrin-3-like n=1 Tax=Diabrotica virgifera virgifera TaxID=50390 RepID=A0A6P7GE55_DIAVI|nr:ankyrin-3-like [Diabrotica virgifera virgifera]
MENWIPLEVGFVDSDTALRIAAKFKHLEIAKYLLAHGADVNAIEAERCWSPLHIATENNDIEMIRLFTEAGANMQCRTLYYGNMPVHVAAYLGYKEIIKYFIEQGIYVDITNTFKMTPLQIAARNGHCEVVDYLLLNNANVHLRGEENKGSIHYAVLGGNAKIVHRLIEKGVDINISDSNTVTPLLQACKQGCVEIVQLLLENGADVDFHTNKGYTLLHIACMYHRLGMVKFLLENGAKVNKKTIEKTTPLYFALSGTRKNKCPSWEIAELLILNGADLQQAEYKGNCPLLTVLRNSLLTSLRDLQYEANLHKYEAAAKVIIKYNVLIYNPVETCLPYKWFWCRDFKELEQYYNDCQNEIKSMMRVVIKNTTVSLYQLICESNKGDAFVKYLRNDNIKNELQNIEDYLKDFLIYRNIKPLVQLRVKEGFKKVELLRDSDLIMKKIAPQLPFEIRYTILEYLNMTDLKTVIKLDLFK